MNGTPDVTAVEGATAAELETRLAVLTRLACDGPPRLREDLLRALLDLYIRADGRIARARHDALGGLLTRLTQSAPRTVRLSMAQHICALCDVQDTAPSQAPPVPAALVKALLDDAPEVALPLLRGWPQLDEATQAALAARLPPAHLPHLHARRDLAPEAAAALLARSDLPDAIAVDLPWRVPARLGPRAVTRALAIEGLETAPDACTVDASALEGFAPDAFTPDPDALAYIEGKAARGEIGEALAVRLLRDGETMRAILCLSALTGLPEAVAARGLSDPSGHAFAVMARATGLGRSCFATLCALLHPASTASETYARMRRYETTPGAQARALTDLWALRFSDPAKARRLQRPAPAARARLQPGGRIRRLLHGAVRAAVPAAPRGASVGGVKLSGPSPGRLST